jgi:hypothetical protein
MEYLWHFLKMNILIKNFYLKLINKKSNNQLYITVIIEESFSIYLYKMLIKRII